jgi:3-hydroxyisobutyrate dehydrogenase-like beta-hydroxyacid dehydrogenase
MTGGVAVLGMGLMGSAIARTLLREGYEVSVWNRSPAKCLALVSDGAAQAANVTEAVRRSDTVVLILNNYDTARKALAEASAELHGKTLISLMTGSPAEAQQFADWVTINGGRYLDGIIAAYPADIGHASTLMYFSGAETVWAEQHEMLKALAGASTYLGTATGAANVMDAAMTAAFYDVSIGAFHEALSFAVTSGVELSAIRRTLDSWMTLLGHELHQALNAVESGDFSSDQATLDTYLAGMQSCRQSMLTAGERAGLLGAAVYNLELAQSAGLGQDGISGQYKIARAYPRPLRGSRNAERPEPLAATLPAE